MKKFKKIVLSAALAASMLVGFGATSLVKPAAAEKVGLNYYLSDYDTRAEAIAAGREWEKKVEKEGVVLLKNKDNALPLAKGSKVTVFGKKQDDMFTYLERAGLKGNREALSFYGNNSRSPSSYTPISGNTTANGKAIGETPVSYLQKDSALEATYKDYADMAFVVFHRSGGEGHDNPRTMKWNGKSVTDRDSAGEANQPVPGARSMDDHYLQLDQNETDLLAYVCEKFAKVTVILASSSQMEVGFLDDPKHYAYHDNIVGGMWITGTGHEGAASVIVGETSPSGRTVDTWARDYKLDPVWMNFGNNLVEGSYQKKGNLYANYATDDGYMSSYRGTYVIYKEGIYLGYRYYETRGYTEGLDKAYTSAAGEVHGTTTTEWNNWYASRVSYPFGYGLSYTTFTQEIVEKNYNAGDALDKNGTITWKVKVTNTGAVSGKEVVQLYYTSPYTTGGIEKSHVVLGAFAKTAEIKPGESDTVTLTMKVRDMASYDYNDANKNGFKGYELEEGDYVIRLMKNAHEEITNVTYNVAETAKFDKDEVTGNTVENRFDKVSNYLLNDTKVENGNYYMSRADFAGTFPKTSFREDMPEWVKNGLNEWEVKNGKQTRDPALDQNDPEYTEVMPTFGAKNGIKLEDLHGLDYDDEKYEKYLDQFTRDQLIQLPTRGNYWTGIDAPNLGMTKTSNIDGPYGFTPQSFVGNGAAKDYVWLGDVTLSAATWNVEIAYERGRIAGNFALWGTGEEYNRIGGFYAPAVNIHRSPFSGRNNEYYSEDGFLTGKMAAAEVRGANDKGFYTYVKHFAINDQETNRLGICTWLNEQSMREIYLRSFEICVKEGKTTGIMSALNRLGYTWTGGCRELLTDVLRNEWGFRGTVVTDSYMGDNSNLSNFDQKIRAGGNLALGNASVKYNGGSATTYHYLRKAAHGICYTLANSAALNKGAHPVKEKVIKSYESGSAALGIVGVEYRFTVATAKINVEAFPDVKAEDIKYTLAEGSKQLPKGLTMAEDGMISGVPQKEANNHKITVVATYQDESVAADFYFNIISADGAIIYRPENANLGTAYVGSSVILNVAEAEIYVKDATEEEIAALPSVTYELGSDTVLPEGLTLSETGVIYGVPTKGCRDYKIKIMAKALGYRSVETEYTLSILNEMLFFPRTLADGKAGCSYGDRIEPADCADIVKYRLKDGSKLPDGLKLTEAGYIIGTPTVAVTDYKFIVEAHSAFADTLEAEYSITISLSFAKGLTLADGKAGEEYLGDIAMASGADNIKYLLKKGTLPEGLTLSENGEITGTPTKAGVYTLTFAASAEGVEEDEVTLTLYVANAEVKETKSGCNGAIAGLLPVTSALGMLAFAVALRKKKED